MKTLRKPLNSTKVINNTLEILSKSHTDSYGSSHVNVRCLECNQIKCIPQAKINIHKCDCEK